MSVARSWRFNALLVTVIVGVVVLATFVRGQEPQRGERGAGAAGQGRGEGRGGGEGRSGVEGRGGGEGRGGRQNGDTGGR